MKVLTTSYSLVAETSSTKIAFFKKDVSFAEIKKIFFKDIFHRLRQTHSDISVMASSDTVVLDPTVGPSKIEGDSLVTLGRDALGVSTADCLPVIIFNDKKMAGVHAGWRGVENEIILKTLKSYFSGEKNISVFIGPHIQWDSFEVDKSLGDQFISQYQKYVSTLPSLKSFGSIDKPSVNNPAKSFIKLSTIARCQLILGGVLAENIWVSDIDTKTDLAWASFRREGKNMGKNLSFVSRRSP